jgi:hypothetical protein
MNPPNDLATELQTGEEEMFGELTEEEQEEVNSMYE